MAALRSRGAAGGGGFGRAPGGGGAVGVGAGPWGGDAPRPSPRRSPRCSELAPSRGPILGASRNKGGAVMERAVLAYSGGLDTSVTIRWLAEQGFEVHAVAVDVGQQEDFGQIRRRGELAGATSVRVIDAVERFAARFLTPAIKANSLYEGKYPMVSGLARPLIADEVIRAARELGAGIVAHGGTGKGNDQVRFEVSFGVLAPDLRGLAPIPDPRI